jgi:acyl-CoA thioesterase I
MIRLVVLFGLLLAGAPSNWAQSAEKNCAAPDGFLHTDGSLPRTAKALREKKAIKIVVIGGNSTSGKANSRPELAFPWRAADELMRRHPGVPIEVVIHSHSGMIAARKLDIVTGPVVKAKPTLVVWQTGTVDAVKSTDVEQFSIALGEGVDVLLASDADVVLMDPQYSPTTAAMINFLPYRNEVDQVAMTRRAVVFRRHDLMRYWVEQGVFTFGEGSKEAMRDEADRAHGCIGRLLADLIEANAR